MYVENWVYKSERTYSRFKDLIICFSRQKKRGRPETADAPLVARMINLRYKVKSWLLNALRNLAA
jgi:hypothetical protein